MINDHMDEPNKKTSAFFDDLLHEFTTDMTNGT